jgi:hypothetical protein
MANAAKKTSRISGEWLGRDLDSWRVRVPCQGGHGVFKFKDHGGVQKALVVAKVFQEQAMLQYEADKAYVIKHGEKPHRETLHITNSSGVKGCFRSFYPNLHSAPTIVWTATWYKNRRSCSARFSTASKQYPTEELARNAAIEMREKMHKSKRRN